MTDEIFNLDHPEFDKFRYQFNQILRGLIESMERKNVGEGKISVTFDIQLFDGSAETGEVNAQGNPVYKTILIPMVQHKIVSSFAVKQNANAAYLGREFCLVWDEEQGNYLLKKVQPGLFDTPDGQD